MAVEWKTGRWIDIKTKARQQDRQTQRQTDNEKHLKVDRQKETDRLTQ